jgi:hypothetical protein
MSQLALADIDRLRMMLLAENDAMFSRVLPIMTAADVQHLGSFSNTTTVRVEENGTVTMNGTVVGHADRFTIPIKNQYAGTPISVTYKSNPSEWVSPRNSNRNKATLSKEKKRARKRIAAASRKRNRK